MVQTDLASDAGKHSGIQVIARAAAVMRALGSNPQGLSLAAIAQIVDLPRSTVQRIITALEAEFLVEALGPSGGFRLGPALGQLISQTQTDIITLLKPQMLELSEQVRESICVCSLVGDKAYVVDRIVAERELRVVFPIGINAPAYAIASGKALLAALSEESLGQLLQDPLPILTPNTPTIASLREQLARIRSGEVAEDHGELIEGLSSFSVILDTYLGRYSIAIVAPSARVATQREVFQRALLTCKQNIEKAIGRAPHNA
ncbi:TPA: IclR family transcriptional regulator [Pseudomonas aeruginosa]|uniref:IclR family transcriptional regulator n=1 Tax=Pseudomonas aeruginosa TaxID=287 RepID=UPI00193C948A|nr:IclR family transcriptional regulator [Pseudomonas aeruginosa]MBI8222876.1 IclR family transcriptional regulator [Pseudomonas aeruginosa]MDP5708000.1 IclR family transcriptional regulator [Pseudomonas aeruginosa]HBO0349182.1 IclR family transcriptional regulator [Pseudomonas aeruginosa]HCF2190302.1 IclR family transcriptional regulator [Pseudomonas aeruginosa]HCW0993876.1 IclR family transcriptional regulator [Pseudomonas aeruginosa]